MKDDPVLIARTLDGDMQAFRWLITKHQRLVTHVVRRVVQDDGEIEEVCQDVFLKVYDKLNTFKGEAKFSTWLVTIAYRISLNHQAKRRLKTQTLENNVEKESDVEMPSTLLEKMEMKESIHTAVNALPDKYRHVITLFHLADMSYEEVANITGMPIGTVKNYLFRGRKLLKEVLVSMNYSDHYER